MKKNEQCLREMWDIIKHTDMCNGSTRRRKVEANFEEIWLITSEFDEKQSTHPQSSTNSKQYKYKETHNEMHHNENAECQRLKDLEK